MSDTQKNTSWSMADVLLSPSTKSVYSLEEKRNSTRFMREEGSDFAIILMDDGSELNVEVHDESLGGLGVIVNDAQDFQPGSQVKVFYAGDHFLGEVRHINIQSDGRYVIGLSCDRIKD